MPTRFMRSMPTPKIHPLFTFTTRLQNHGPCRQSKPVLSTIHLSMLFWTMIRTSSVSLCRFPCTLFCSHVTTDALSQGNLFSLDMGLLNAANSTPLNWVNDEQTPYPLGYAPVMALAQNHIHFLDVPNVPAGSADIFVIHCAYCTLITKGRGTNSHTRFLLPTAAPDLPTLRWERIPSHLRASRLILPGRQHSESCTFFYLRYILM